jgi:hypothetical protein
MSFATKVLLRSEESGGHVSVIENVLPPHFSGPHLHTHDFDEAFYVLEDELVTKGPVGPQIAWGG